MRTRPKPPSLVSMWMLDVFCCALGCVTLLWLLNNRAAMEETKRAESSLRDLTTARSELLAAASELAATKRRLNDDIESLKAKLVAAVAERDETTDKLAVARADVASLQTQLASSAEELARKQASAEALSKKLAAAVLSTEEVMKLLREKQTEAEQVALRAKKAEAQLDDADAKLRSLAKETATAQADRAALRKTGDELAAARAAAAAAQQKLDDANAQIIDLQGDKKKLADKYDKLRIDSEAKFAGIALTGRRVAFVVDMSKSMVLLDDKTPAAGKWPTVGDTVAKVMRSLPDLEQYQVVLFSRKARYLFGTGTFEPYRGEESIKRVRDGLAAVEPVGDTNLYDAFDLAFKLKPAGLDTVYLFSDGLPTSGAGLTAEQDKTFTDSQRTEALSRHIRQTLTLTWNPASGGRRVRVNAVGFFFESPEVGAFLWALARENDGSFVGMSRP